MGANVECEELGCVVWGPFKPNKLREVRGLVWRPWINKPSEMTMRCADICHHTSLDSKYNPRCFPHFSLSLSSLCLLHRSSSGLSFTLQFASFFKIFLLSLQFYLVLPSRFFPRPSPPFPPFHLSPVTPSIQSFIHAWLAVRPEFCMCYRQSAQRFWHSGISQQMSLGSESCLFCNA